MASQPIAHFTALGLAQELRAGRVTAAQALDACFAAIDERNGELRCFCTLAREQAYARAAEIQGRLDAGDVRSPLAGVPFAAQDLICAEGIGTACGSKMLGGFVPPYSAAAIERLQAADMILLGKTGVDEFGLGGANEKSTAAVAGGLAPAAIAIDTSGGVRQSAAFDGAFGLKPTYGTVSRHGGVIAVSSMDQIGPVARDAADCAALYALLKGADPRDGMSVEHPDTPALPLEGLRVGVPAEFMEGGLQPDIAAAVLAAKGALVARGATAVEISLPMTKYAVSAYYIIAGAEVSSNLARYDGITWGRSSPEADSLRETYIRSRSEGFGLEVKRRLMLGNLALSSDRYEAYFKKAQQARRLIADDFRRAFEACDVLLGPAAPAPIPGAEADPLSRYLNDVDTAMPSLAGLPALGIPGGVQLIGRAFEENTLFAAAGGIAA